MSENTYSYIINDIIDDLRPFVITASSFAGTGKYASHALGFNQRDWKELNYSISTIMNMNMFGMPHTGGDVCGFFGT